VYVDASPYSYYNNATHQFIGYSVDICHEIIEYIREKLGIERLEIKYKSITSKNRFSLIESGAYDLECGETTNKSVKISFRKSSR